MELAGKILEYEYDNGERYSLLFGIKTVTWEYLTGTAAGSSGTNSYGAVEITPNILLISWSTDDGEVVSIAAKFQNTILHCCNTHEGKINLLEGQYQMFC